MHDDAAGDTSGTPRATRSGILRIDIKSPYVGKILPPRQPPKCDRPAHYEYKNQLFDVHGRLIEPGKPLPPEESDPDVGAGGEIIPHDDEIVPATQILAQIRDMPLARLRALAGKLLGEENLHRSRQQIEVQLREWASRSKLQRAPNATRLARAAAARAETPVEQVEVEDFPDS